MWGCDRRYRIRIVNLDILFPFLETERYHLVGPKMGLGFCRFVERSRLYPPSRGTSTAENTPAGAVQKSGFPAITAPASGDHRLVGPNDSVTFFAEVRQIMRFFLFRERIWAEYCGFSLLVRKCVDFARTLIGMILAEKWVVKHECVRP